jgi:hypothetical protein
MLGDSRTYSRVDCILCNYCLGNHYIDGSRPYVPVGDGTMIRIQGLLREGYAQDTIEAACHRIAAFWNLSAEGQNQNYIFGGTNNGKDDSDDDGATSSSKTKKTKGAEYGEFSLGLDVVSQIHQPIPLPNITAKLVYDHYTYHSTSFDNDAIRDLKNVNRQIQQLMFKKNHWNGNDTKQLKAYLDITKTLDSLYRLKTSIRKELTDSENTIKK